MHFSRVLAGRADPGLENPSGHDLPARCDLKGPRTLRKYCKLLQVATALSILFDTTDVSYTLSSLKHHLGHGSIRASESYYIYEGG